MKPKAVVLLSGGIDSSVAMALARAEGNDVYALSFLYGQRHAAEVDYARTQAIKQHAREFRAVRLEMADLETPLLGGAPIPKDRVDDGRVAPTYVPARNTVFLALALGWAEVLGARDIYLGANKDDEHGYPDCRPAYMRAFEYLAEVATKAGVEGAAFRIRAPLLLMNKTEIVRRGMALGVDFSSTSSCYDPPACGRCDSCRLRLAAFAANGLADPISYSRGGCL